MADLSPLLGEEQKSDFGAIRSVEGPQWTNVERAVTEHHQTLAELGQLFILHRFAASNRPKSVPFHLLRARLLAVLPRAEICPSYLRGFVL